MLWLDALNHCLKHGQACVVVTITAVDGSAPRGVGARMVVSQGSLADTIGGGALEHHALAQARAMLDEKSPTARIASENIVLGKALSQCCGGRVTLQFDYHPACAFNVVVFGAGHVAQALASILAQLPCRATFYDARQEWLQRLPVGVGVGGARMLSTRLLGNNHFEAVQQCPERACYLVMTHSHELDYELVEAILSRGDSEYCGLIASKSKAQRFRTRLARKQFTEVEIDKLTAPIGRHVRAGNLPMEVAVAAAADLLMRKAARNESANSLLAEDELAEVSAFIE